MSETPVSWRERLAATPLIAAALARSPRLIAAGLAVGGAAVAVVVLVVAFRGSPVAPEVNLPRATPSGAMPTAVGGAGASPGPSAEGATAEKATAGAAAEPEPESYVYAAGAVARPGVYRVRAGGRVADVLDAAGGPATNADLEQVNLAAKVTDGERVFVPRQGQAVPPVVAGGVASGTGAGAGTTAAPVDLNTATLEQLDSLPGVGPATAQAILDYRTEHGRFAQVQELLDVRGIGDAKLAGLRSKVRV